MDEAWEKIKKVMNSGDPEKVGKYSGWNRTMCDVPASWVDRAAMSALPRDGSGDVETLAEKPETATPTNGISSSAKQRGIRCETHGFIEQRGELYLELAHKD